jgi:hypothetical protein
MSKFGGSIIIVFMKRIYLSLIVLMYGTGLMAQQEFYIFIQEPSHQPFYVRMGEESHSSSAEGHIILPRLKDSVYNLYIGMPKARGEDMFTIAMKKKDHGYEIRNVNGKRQLFDLQTLEPVNAVGTSVSDGQTIRKTDDYSVLMAGVVEDSAVLYMSPSDTLNTDTVFAKNKVATGVSTAVNDTAKAKKPARANVAAGGNKDSVNVKKQAPVIVAANENKDSTKVKNPVPDIVSADDNKLNETAQPDSSFRDKRDIIRVRTENVPEGRMMIYVDRTGAVNDTIRIIIPRRL